MMLMGGSYAWAETSTVNALKISNTSETWTGSAEEDWAVAVSGGALGQNVIKDYAQVGTKKDPSTSITFSTSEISGTITSIVVACASYNGLGTVSTTVGGSAFGTQSQSIPSWSNDSGGNVTFEGNASGAIVITMTNGTGGRAMYIKSITVTYQNDTPGLLDNDLALTGAPVSLSFDLYNNYAPQTISYTTSSSGAVSIAENDYATFNIDQTNKTITVTPKDVVTPSAQTITVCQAADNSYKYGEKEFTISVVNNTPQYTVTYKANGGTGEDIVKTYYEGTDVSIEGNRFTYSGHSFTKWNTAADGTGTDYQPNATIEDINASYVLFAQWEESNESTYDFTQIEGFSGWGNTYEEHVVDYSDATVTFASANKQTGTITNQPVTKGGDVTLVLTDGSTMSSATFVCTQWGTKTQTITLHYSTDGGQTYTSTGVTSTNFTITDNNLPAGTNAVKITFSNSSNQVGIASASIVKVSSTTPSFTITNNNEIAYDATSGSFDFTVNNPANDGVITVSENVDWISNAAISENSVTFTTTTNEARSSREGVITLTYTYNTNETVTEEVTVTQAGNTNIVMTIAEVRTQGTGNVKTQGVVTSCVGVTAYIQDETAAICVYGDTDHPINFAVGDEIAVEGTLAEYKGLVEIKYPVYSVLSQGNTVEPEVMTIAEINASTNQGWLVRIEDAKVTEISDQNTTIKQGENSIVVRGISSEVMYGLDDIISLTGNIGCYNNAQIANPTEVYVAQEGYYLAGTWTNGWSIEGMKKLTKNADGTYSYTFAEFPANTQFKIVEVNNGNQIWYDGGDQNALYGIHNGWWKDITLVGNDNAKNFIIENEGTYTFTVKTSPMTLTVTGWDYYLRGSFNQWTNNDKFTDEGNGVYKLNKHIDANTQFKVYAETNKYYSNNTFSQENCDVLLYLDHSNNMLIDVEGDYEFTLTAGNNSLNLAVTGWPVIISGDKFVKVTSTDNLTSGQYLIVYEGANVAFDGSLETLDAINNTIDVDIVNDANVGNAIAATSTNTASAFTIDLLAGTIKSASGKYIGKTSSDNGLDTSAETLYTNTITFDAGGNAVITASGNSTLRFNAASDQARFRYYGSGQEDIQLYKLVTENDVTFSEDDANDANITANAGETKNATLKRTLSNSFWSTFSVPFNVDANQVKTVLGENVELREFQGSEGTVIKFQEATAITAGHAYLVKPAATVTNPVFNGVTVVNTTGIADSDNNGYGFVGAVIKKTLKTDQTELFLGTDAKFYYPEADKATMKGLRGYFVVPAGTVPSKLSVDVEGSGIATSINSMNIEGMGDGNFYNLNGQRVNAPQKGLYIVNGKKVIIK